MSYDLMVFNQQAAPTSKAAFVEWASEQMEWSEDHGYDDPAVSTPELRAWFLDMIQAFPAMNGPFAVSDDDLDESNVTDYSVGTDVIYAAFSWSLAEEAYAKTVELARQHRVGFYNVSSDELNVWVHTDGDFVQME